MVTEYILMHKNIPCAFITIDKDSGALTDMIPVNKEHLPYIGTADIGKIKRWWRNRAIPGGREDLRRILVNAGCENPHEYLAKNLALSVSDVYWICPVDMDLVWEQVNLADRDKKQSIVAFHNATSYDRNASLGGQMSKYWDTGSEPPVLVKLAGMFYGQQAINEEFATLIHEKQKTEVPFVKYWTEKTKENDRLAKCRAFTSNFKEFVPAYEILNSQKKNNSVSLYDEYITIASQNGIDKEWMQKCMDYQTVTDFVISNTDRHLMNFGILRDPDTLKFISSAPIFDSGNSMFYDNGEKRYTRAGILEQKISALHEREEYMLQHIKNRNVINFELLPSRKEVEEFYVTRGISEEKSYAIAYNYGIKYELLHDFQNGQKISLFLERKREQKSINEKEDTRNESDI